MVTTNAMRLLTQAGIPFTPLCYAYDESDLSGVHAAQALGLDPDEVFKTLVLRGERTGLFVCCIPVAAALDLKKAAKLRGDKGAQMLHMRELLPATGYIRGGCSPVGMKKQLPTILDETAQLFPAIAVSAGCGARCCCFLLTPFAPISAPAMGICANSRQDVPTGHNR